MAFPPSQRTVVKVTASIFATFVALQVVLVVVVSIDEGQPPLELVAWCLGSALLGAVPFAPLALRGNRFRVGCAAIGGVLLLLGGLVLLALAAVGLLVLPLAFPYLSLAVCDRASSVGRILLNACLIAAGLIAVGAITAAIASLV